MTTDDPKASAGWSSTAKRFLGAGLVAVAGFFGAAAMNVLSAPKDSVAYDLIQSFTGMLKNREPATPAHPPAAPATAEAAGPAERQAALIPAPPALPLTPPKIEPPASQPTPQLPAPSAKMAPPSSAPESAAPSEQAPAGSMADRVRQTTELARKIAASTAALNANRVLTLVDRTEASICGVAYRIEVTSVATGQGSVALRDPGANAQPIELSVGKPRDVRSGCRVELLGATEDLTNRRAQLRETKSP